MRCNCIKCHYNDDYYCRQPDYVSIDENGECDQMYIPTVQSSNNNEEEAD